MSTILERIPTPLDAFARSRTRLSLGLLVVLIAAYAMPAEAQQRVAYIDSEYVLEHMPEYDAVDEELSRLTAGWEQELSELEAELEERREEFQARELLYTDREREERQQEIRQLQQEIEQLHQHYFGPEGQLFQEQQRLLRPIQERVLEAVERLAQERDYDYVFDKSGDFLFLFADEQHDLSDAVLQELGIEID